MNKIYASFVVLIFPSIFFNPVNAQIKQGTFINVSAGLGLAAPDDETDINGSGFYT